MLSSPEVKDFYQYMQMLKDQRAPKEPVWKEISEYFLGISNPENRNNPVAGLMDGSTILAAKTLAAAFLGMMINPNDRNIELGHKNKAKNKLSEYRKLMQYLSDCTMDFLLEVDNGFYTKAHEMLTEYVNYGQGTMLIEDRGGKVRFLSCATTSVYIDVDDEWRPNAGVRVFKWTLRQLEQRYPQHSNDWPQALKASFKNNPLEKVELYHAVFPKENSTISRMIKGKHQQDKPYTYVIALCESEHIFEIKGSSVQPFLSPRFDRLADDIYGTGPGQYALEDARTINKMGGLNIDAVERAVRPARYAPAQGWLSPLDDAPASLTLYDEMEGELDVKTMGPEGNPSIGFEFVDRHTSNMFQLFYADRLRQLQKKAEVKEMELMSDKEERTRDLAPQLARLETEWMRRVVELVLIYKLKDFMDDYEGTVPEGFNAKNTDDIKVTLKSPLARAQAMLEAANTKRFVDQFLVPLAQIDPQVLSYISFTDFVRYLIESFYIPEKIVKDEEVVKQEQADAKKQGSLSQGAATLNEASQGIKNLAQAQQANPGLDPTQLLQGLG